MQVVIIEQDYIFHEGKLYHRWNVQLLGTGKVVATIKEIEGERHELKTFGDHPSGNRYRVFDSMEKTTEVVLKWAARRFRGSVAHERIAQGVEG